MIEVIYFSFKNEIRDYLKANNIPYDIYTPKGKENIYLEIKKGILTDKELYQLKKLDRKFGNTK